jgi:hypothetical protein
LAGKLVRLAGFAEHAHFATLRAGKKTKRDSSLRATPFGMTMSFKGGVDCSDKKPFATAQDKVQLDPARDRLRYAVFHFSLKFVLI